METKSKNRLFTYVVDMFIARNINKWQKSMINKEMNSQSKAFVPEKVPYDGQNKKAKKGRGH